MDGRIAPPGPVPDGALVRRASMGDRDAFGEIAQRHGPSMFRYATSMLDGDVDDAEDAVQNALMKAWQGLPGFEGRSAVRTWLFRITANEVLQSRRRRRPVALDDALLSNRAARKDADPAHQFAEVELWQTLLLALAELPWRQRASWLLREVEGMSYDQIAAVLGTTETVVRGQLHRARRTLAVRMEQWQ